MPDILIQHCKLQVVRRGGWTWGPDRRHLISMATQALPGLIAEALSHLLHDLDTDVSIDTLLIRLGPGAATVLLGGGGSDSSPVRDALRTALARQLRPQLPELIANFSKYPLEPNRRTPLLAHTDPLDLAQLILAWHKEGSLQARLAWFAPAALQAWDAALLADPPYPLQSPATIQYEPSAWMQALLAKPPTRGQNLRAFFSLRLLLIAEILASNQGRVHTHDLRRLIHLYLRTPAVNEEAGNERPANARSQASTDEQVPVGSAPGTELAVQRSKHELSLRGPSICPSVSSIDTRIFSVLPFLVLGVLHRIGYLRTLTAALHLSGATPLSAAFATALAYKLLRPLELGWRRDADSLHVGAVFAGLAMPLEQQVLRSFERQVETQLSAVDAELASAVRSGYDVQKPLLIQQVDGTYLCFDTNGMFPISFVANDDDLASLLRIFGPETIFMDATTISPAVIECIERNACTFITDALPGRGDQWQPLDHQRQYWTPTSRPAPKALTESYSSTKEDGGEFVNHFIRQRPVIAGAPSASTEMSLDSSVTLAAGMALAQLAHTLWHERESTNAVLAFQRFHDLEARVQIDMERVLIRLALGRRFFDLRDHGLLRDITAVPWLDNRTIQFAES